MINIMKLTRLGTLEQKSSIGHSALREGSSGALSENSRYKRVRSSPGEVQ